MNFAPLEKLPKNQADITLDCLEKTYDEWADNYDHDLKSIGYPGPLNAVKIVEKLLNNKDAKVLDMAAGTGIVGEEFQALGYKNIDASDMSVTSLEIAKQKGVYKHVFRCCMGEERIEAEDNTYDAITVVGCWSIPIKVDVFREMNRVLKKGGYLVSCFRPDVWSERDIYGYRGALNDSSQWVKISEELRQYHGQLATQDAHYSSYWHFVVYQKC
eukprot:TRINITY_DN873_c0_g1_i5.p1 TRINITY_DN873_c0_g1~~TRINITY_DN873_c0_g1_i5.p1  ORF type:complete len:235 (-),score=24.36 TRINITY_DN873_c0_g1_i5:36-680(-)